MLRRNLLLILLLALAAHAQDATRAGQFTVEHPTLRNLGFEWAISRDANRNASVRLRGPKDGAPLQTHAAGALRSRTRGLERRLGATGAARRHHRRTCRPVSQRPSELGRPDDDALRRDELANEYPHGFGNPPDGDPPPDGNRDLYLGPVPAAAFKLNRFNYSFRWFYDYSAGQLTANGLHFLDMIQWGLGRDAPLPVTAMGGKSAVQDNRQTVDVM